MMKFMGVTRNKLKVTLSVFIFLLINASSFISAQSLLGSGATFPYPFYKYLFNKYKSISGVDTQYLPIGSGNGFEQLKNRHIDFGASDVYIKDDLLKELPGDIVHIPMCVGAVGIAFNLPNKIDVKLTPEIIANIFAGKIKNWDHPSIQKVNSGVKLPKLHIIVVHRNEVSGTTFVFTEFLTTQSKMWKRFFGSGGRINWPTGLGIKGNEGVAKLIKQVNGSIGYIEAVHAQKHKLKLARVQNDSGKFVRPTYKYISEAGSDPVPEDLRISMIRSSAKKGYPIRSYSWIMLYKEQAYNDRSKEQAVALVKLIKWMVNDGQNFAKTVGYGRVPEIVSKQATKLLKDITYNGKPIYSLSKK